MLRALNIIHLWGPVSKLGFPQHLHKQLNIPRKSILKICCILERNVLTIFEQPFSFAAWNNIFQLQQIHNSSIALKVAAAVTL